MSSPLARHHDERPASLRLPASARASEPWRGSDMVELRVLEPANPHFTKIGGTEGARRLAHRFHAAIEELPEAATIGAMHPDISAAREKLTLFLIEWLGGPKDYSREHGPPRPRMRHARFPITWAERDAWMACMRRALAEVVPDAALRDELTFAFARTADALINRI